MIHDSLKHVEPLDKIHSDRMKTKKRSRTSRTVAMTTKQSELRHESQEFQPICDKVFWILKGLGPKDQICQVTTWLEVRK